MKRAVLNPLGTRGGIIWTDAKSLLDDCKNLSAANGDLLFEGTRGHGILTKIYEALGSSFENTTKKWSKGRLTDTGCYGAAALVRA